MGIQRKSDGFSQLVGGTVFIAHLPVNLLPRVEIGVGPYGTITVRGGQEERSRRRVIVSRALSDQESGKDNKEETIKVY